MFVIKKDAYQILLHDATVTLDLTTSDPLTLSHNSISQFEQKGSVDHCQKESLKCRKNEWH